MLVVVWVFVYSSVNFHLTYPLLCCLWITFTSLFFFFRIKKCVTFSCGLFTYRKKRRRRPSPKWKHLKFEEGQFLVVSWVNHLLNADEAYDVDVDGDADTDGSNNDDDEDAGWWFMLIHLFVEWGFFLCLLKEFQFEVVFYLAFLYIFLYWHMHVVHLETNQKV